MRLAAASRRSTPARSRRSRTRKPCGSSHRMTELRWHPAAAREAQAVRRWYRVDQEAPDAARRFQAALQRALLQIATAPERWPIVVDDLRKRPLRGFPHRVIYRPRGDHVLIVAVMHERQLPGYWSS